MGVRFPKPSRKVKVILAIVLVLVLGAGAWTLKHRQDQKNSERAAQVNACGTDAIGKDIKKDISILTPSKVSSLKPFSDKIEVLPNHEKSANCMYILASYSAYTSAYTKAKSYYASLQALKGKGVQIDSNFKAESVKLDDYMKKVDEIEKSLKAGVQTTGPGMVNQKAGGNGQ